MTKTRWQCGVVLENEPGTLISRHCHHGGWFTRRVGGGVPRPSFHQTWRFPLSPENFHQEIKAGMEHSAMTGCTNSTGMTPEYRLHSGFYFSLPESINRLGFILSGESLSVNRHQPERLRSTAMTRRQHYDDLFRLPMQPCCGDAFPRKVGRDRLIGMPTGNWHDNLLTGYGPSLTDW